MKKNWIAWSACAALALVLAWVMAAPWITVYRMKDAAQARDGQALAGYVDFDSVRQSLKDQVNARMLHGMGGGEGKELNPLAALVAPLAGAVVDKMVDAYITPSGVARLMAGHPPEDRTTPGREGRAETAPKDDGAARKPLAGADMGYRGMDRFVVTTHGQGGDTQFVLGRRGLGWKLAEIILPPQ